VSRCTRAVTVRGVTLTLWMAGVVLGAVSCSSDDIAGPSDSVSPPAAGTALGPTAAGALSFYQVDAGEIHTCGVTMDNLAYCWGWNSNYGALGDGTRTNRPAPVRVIGGLRFKVVSAGSSHTCGVAMEDRAYCWGGGFFGQLGDGTNTPTRLAPVLVSGGLLFREITTGSAHTCGLTTKNRLYCWGLNTFGQLGDGTTMTRVRPVLVSSRHRFRLVSAGDDHSCAVTKSHKTFCWGSNSNGRLGDGSTVLRRLTPVAVYGKSRFSQVSAGRGHTCAATADYRTFCWGDGTFGQIGDGNTITRNTPTEVAGGLSFRRVSAGAYHTCGETTDNRGYCWGNNGVGQLGDGTHFNSRLTPVAIAGGLRFSQLSAGGIHSCGKTPAAVAYCWGWNITGEVGDGTTIQRLSPVPVAGAT
jgi:alpha-tubulin suppressor-like RCC1 family protein